ncbi:polyribonucleotide nucleotidyltransferase [candidate division KSB1 bacterium]|nr:polyribonucleotide nucleotidyltransferase [candidate division KSB1 bacterium]
MVVKSVELGGRTLSIETGRMAKQANGAVIVQYGETVILAVAVATKKPVENRGFFPLSVDYRERAYAAGKIPGGFFKREGRPSEKEILSARLIDRPIRPLFPDGYMHEVQISITVLSSDKENDADVLGTIGASTALVISNIPFEAAIGSVRVGRIDGEFILNPTFSQLESSDMNVVLAASEEAIAMVEGEAHEVSEEDMIAALEFGHEAIKKITQLQQELVKECGNEKMVVEPVEIDAELKKAVEDKALKLLPDAITIKVKRDRYNAVDAVMDSIKEELAETYPEQERTISSIFHDVQKNLVRNMILDKKKRIDGRGYYDIRNITSEIGVLPRTHGSALFTRGETQSLAVATLGTKVDEQKVEGLDGSSWKSYMLHYNFPSFSVGEVRPFRGPGRREIGHGNLAERALKPILPNELAFPYTIRIVSDILESNGSSSMASVCAGSLSLMDAGVPIKSPVAGIAMGLIKEDDRIAILTDILGDEDHLGDMDFKVTGTRKGVTAFQMDIKITGLSSAILKDALDKAKTARFSILDNMDQTISEPKSEISPYAPHILAIQIAVDDIGMVIGPGGKMIREIVETTGAEINIEDDGVVQISAVDEESCMKAKTMIDNLTKRPEPGTVYQAKVKKIMNFGAFVEFLPGKEGLLHISEIAVERVNRVEDHLKLGDIVEVKLMKVTPDGKYDLSRKALLKE